jgi:hypothetical protein
MASVAVALMPKPSTNGKILNLDKFICGMVARLIRTYQINDFVIAGHGSDYREDMMQIAWLAVLNVQKNHPKKAKIPQYLKAVITNSLLKSEQSGRNRRLNTSNILDEPSPPSIQSLDTYAATEAKHDIQALISKADLSDAESMCVEMQYGFWRGEDTGPCTIARSAQLAGRSESWVRARLTAAHIKLEVATE